MPSDRPAITAFARQIGEGLAFGQVWVRPCGRGYELRHVDDRTQPVDLLRPVTAHELRVLSQSNVAGAFRPLKGSPDLRAGWKFEATTLSDLDFGLYQLYPGSVADWHFLQQNPEAAISYREYTERQTGMYRVTALVSDAQAREIARACCEARFCLKRRIWAVPGLPVDPPEAKSLIPCLEPCPVLMEFARKAARIEQEDPTALTLRPEEVHSLRALIHHAQSHPPLTPARQADFSDPLNPRRLELLLNKLASADSTSAHAGH